VSMAMIRLFYRCIAFKTVWRSVWCG